MELEIFKQRASGAGVLLTDPRTNKDKAAGILAKTVQTELDNWLKERLFKRRKQIHSKYLDKGNAVETDSLRWLADVLDLGMIFETNDEHFEDEFFTGTPDLITSDTVFDLKNSWDYTTFPMIGGQPDKKYVAQLQVYMHLTGRKKAALVHILSNTPDDLVQKDLKQRLWDLRAGGHNPTEEELKQITEQTIAYHNYDEVEDRFKFRKFEFEYDPELIEELQRRVVNARNYIKSNFHLLVD